MAYVYDEIESQLRQPGAEKTNIFGDQGTTAATAQAPTPKTEISAGGQRREVSEDSRSSAPAASGPSRNVQAFRAAQEKVKAPQVFGDIASQVTGKQQQLQQQAQQYTEAARQKDFEVKEPEIETAIATPGAERETIASRLAGQRAPQAERFTTDIANVSDRYVATPEGIGEYFRDISGPRYSAGEMAFDAMLAGRDPETQLARDRALRAQQGLAQQLGTIGTETTAQAQDIYQTAWERANEQLRQQLEGRATGIEEEVARLEAEEEARRAAQIGLAGEYGVSQAEEPLEAMRQTLRDIYGAEGQEQRLEESLGLLQGIDIDPSQYTRIGDVDIDPSSIITSGLADPYNTIMSLLGQEDMLQAGPAADPMLGFDIPGYEQAASESYIGARQAEDVRLQEQQQRILEDAARRAETTTSQWLSPEFQQQFKEDLTSRMMREMGYEGQIEAPDISDYLTFYPHARAAPTDVLTQEDVDTLNAIRRSLGSMGPEYEFGGAQFEDYGFREEDYRQALRDLFGAREVTPTGTAPVSTELEPGPEFTGSPLAGWFPGMQARPESDLGAGAPVIAGEPESAPIGGDGPPFPSIFEQLAGSPVSPLTERITPIFGV